MIEFGLPLRGNQQSTCYNAANAFLHHGWKQNKVKVMSETNIRTSLTRKAKFLGGLYDLDYVIDYQNEVTQNWKIKLKTKLSGQSYFSTKSRTESAQKLCAVLNKKKRIFDVINQVDLLGIEIEQTSNQILLKVTPVGGGICFLALPPVRYTVPLPLDQAKTFTELLALLNETVVSFNSDQ